MSTIKSIHIGVGGWTFEPWRDGMFFPEGWPKTRELEYARRQLSAIEVNGTQYSSQKPATIRQMARRRRDGHEPAGVPKVETAAPPVTPHDVFMCFIGGAKERAPAAAMALLKRLKSAS